MKIHYLKSWPQLFQPLTNGDIELTLRKNDRNYQPGEFCKFFEWTKEGGLTGRSSPYYRIKYVLTKIPGLKSGYAVLLLDGPFYCKNQKEELPDERYTTRNAKI